MPSPIEYLDTPRIAYWKMPEDEQPSARHISSSLDMMSAYLRDFRSALELFRFTQTNMTQSFENRDVVAQLSGWMSVAARDGAMTLYHFGKMIEGIRASFKPCPTFKAQVNHLILRESEKRFKESFPLYLKMRHAIAHSAELLNTEAAVNRNSFSGTYSDGGVGLENVIGGMIVQGITNDQFTTTFEGEIISYRLNPQAYANLRSILLQFFSGFEPTVA